MVKSWLSTPPGSNRPEFCSKVALVALWASSSSLPPLYPGVLDAWVVSLRVSRLSQRLLLYNAIRTSIMNAYNRFSIDNANCVVVCLKENRKEIETRHPREFYGCRGGLTHHPAIAAISKQWDRPPELFFRKRLSNSQVKWPEYVEREIMCICSLSK